jgi:hypothetical protein
VGYDGCSGTVMGDLGRGRGEGAEGQGREREDEACAVALAMIGILPQKIERHRDASSRGNLADSTAALCSTDRGSTEDGEGGVTFQGQQESGWQRSNSGEK